jgi:hypothetical protein
VTESCNGLLKNGHVQPSHLRLLNDLCSPTTYPAAIKKQESAGQRDEKQKPGKRDSLAEESRRENRQYGYYAHGDDQVPVESAAIFDRAKRKIDRLEQHGLVRRLPWLTRDRFLLPFIHFEQSFRKRFFEISLFSVSSTSLQCHCRKRLVKGKQSQASHHATTA